jgi:hypothetical protein
MLANKKQCFVIMPFSKTNDAHTEEYWNEHFEDFLKPLIEENPLLEAHRSESLNGDIIKQIITNLITAPVVIADLTDFNPNVFWELGVRQSFKFGTITIAQENTELPFDILSKGTLFYYPSNHRKNAKFCREFKSLIAKIVEKKNAPDSTVLETISGRGTLFEIVHQEEALRRTNALIDEHQWNRVVFSKVQETATKNRDLLKKGESEKITFVSARFSNACCELLHTERYLDENESFYKTIGTHFRLLGALNDELNEWSSNIDCDTWFIETKDAHRKMFDKYGETIEKANIKLNEKMLFLNPM